MPDTSNRRRALTAALALMLAACAGRPPEVPVETPVRPARTQISTFGLTARAVITQGQRAESIRLAWEHSPAHDVMGFENAMGLVVAELQRDALGARWLTHAGERYEARNADDLIARLTNRPVPIRLLSRWVLGSLGDGTSSTLDPMGRLVEGQDGAWRVRILAYEVERPDALPRIVEVETAGLRIRLAIESWVL